MKKILINDDFDDCTDAEIESYTDEQLRNSSYFLVYVIEPEELKKLILQAFQTADVLGNLHNDNIALLDFIDRLISKALEK